MWKYEKRLQYPVKITQPNPKIAQYIMSQYGGPDGEMGASMRYLSQRYAMPYDVGKAVLTDIGTEELAHLEIVAAIVHQLTRNLTMEEVENSGFGPYYIDHTAGIWPQAAGGVRLMPVSSSPRAIQLRICVRIWQQNRKPGAPTITSSASSKIRKSAIRSASSENGKWFISSVSVKPCVMYRIT